MVGCTDPGRPLASAASDIREYSVWAFLRVTLVAQRI
jgi:hypothetical protein